MVYDDHFLVDPDGAVVYLSDTDTAHIFIIVYGADQYLGSGLRITLRSGDVVDDCLEQGSHVFGLIIQAAHSVSVLRGSEQERAVQLFVRCVQIHQQLQNLVHDLQRTRLRTVDFIDADDDRKVKLKGFAQHEFGLRHGALEGVHHQNNAVYHLQDALHFAAEVCVARGIHNIDFHAVVGDGCVFGKDCNSAFSFNVSGIHDALRYFLICAEDAALL